MGKKTINANEILADIKSGIDDAVLMEKYQLSAQQLKSLFEEFVENGSVRVEELYRLEPITPEVPTTEWKCPRCDAPLSSQFQVCPKCKVYVPKPPKEQSGKPENEPGSGYTIEEQNHDSYESAAYMLGMLFKRFEISVMKRPILWGAGFLLALLLFVMLIPTSSKKSSPSAASSPLPQSSRFRSAQQTSDRRVVTEDLKFRRESARFLDDQISACHYTIQAFTDIQAQVQSRELFPRTQTEASVLKVIIHFIESFIEEQRDKMKTAQSLKAYFNKCIQACEQYQRGDITRDNLRQIVPDLGQTLSQKEAPPLIRGFVQRVVIEKEFSDFMKGHVQSGEFIHFAQVRLGQPRISLEERIFWKNAIELASNPWAVKILRQITQVKTRR